MICREFVGMMGGQIHAAAGRASGNLFAFDVLEGDPSLVGGEPLPQAGRGAEGRASTLPA